MQCTKRLGYCVMNQKESREHQATYTLMHTSIRQRKLGSRGCVFY